MREGLALIVAVGLGLGCGSSGAPGSEGRTCLPSGACASGLSCVANVCTRRGDGGPGDGASERTGDTSAGGFERGPKETSDATNDVPMAGDERGDAVMEGGSEAGPTDALPPADAADSSAPGDAPEGDAVRDASACTETASDASEDIVAPACGLTPATTAGAYGGLVKLEVSGVLMNLPGVPLDAFYNLDGSDNPTTACPDCLRYNRFAEGGCVCAKECTATSHRVADVLVGPYPAFNPTHVYSVTIDLGGAPADRLHFGMSDCGCSDNSGSWSIDVTSAAPVCGS
jgi:hypothetical protein